MAADPFDSSLDLLRRLDPKHTKRHLDGLVYLVPDITEDLLSSVDQPLAVRRCKQTGREYLLCDYNRDGDSYRSPWSNQFDPPLDDGPGAGGVGGGPGGVGNEGAGEAAVPGERVRKMEVRANEAFDIYRELYYEGGVSSVYLWNLDDGFAGVVLLKKGMHSTPGEIDRESVFGCVLYICGANNPTPKTTASPSGGGSEGVWDSIHVFEASERGRTTNYKLTSTVILTLSSAGAAANPALGDMDLSGNMTRQLEQDLRASDDESHIANIGRLVEDMELKMRNLLQEVYFGKAKDVVGDLRSLGSLSEGRRDRDAQRELIGSMRR
ncbi:hypothetical protein RB595_007305 [Gaeumannomyces hyphopodioides]